MSPIEPMLAQSTDRNIEDFGDNWVAEPKYDGSRVIYISDGDGDYAMYSRNGKDYSHKFDDIARKLSHRNVILDGELIWMDNEGNHHFKPLGTDRQKALMKDNLVPYYVVFDIMYKGQTDLYRKTLEERRSEISYFNKDGWIKIKRSSDIREMYNEYVKRKGFEGLMLKRKDSIYKKDTRSSDWVKIKPQMEDDFLVVGYTDSDARKFGSLVLTDGKNYVGRVGSGLDQKELEKKMTSVTRDKSFFRPSEVDKEFHPVKPFVVQVRYQSVSDSGKLRHPVLERVRENKTTDSFL